jgi:uncharacterized protein YkwD
MEYGRSTQAVLSLRDATFLVKTVLKIIMNDRAPFFSALSLLLCATVLAQAATPQRTVSEQYLFQAANAERTQRGLPTLRWDDRLFRAAGNHAQEMATRQSISHQYPGEPELEQRGKLAGARFSTIAENVAMAPTAVRIHDAWMNSPHHRDNLLDPSVDSVAISVVQCNGELYAVEDFDRSVAELSLDEQEQKVGQLLQQTAAVDLLPASEDARQTCTMESGYAGHRQPWFVMRYTAADLTRLPEQIKTKLATGKYHQAAIGACEGREKQPFTAFNIAILLYP